MDNLQLVRYASSSELILTREKRMWCQQEVLDIDKTLATTPSFIGGKLLHLRGLYLLVLAPVRNLPSHVLQRVFAFATIGDEPLPLGRTASRISGVCKAWRAVISKPPFTTFLIDATSLRKSSVDSISAIIGRTGTHPLDITICTSPLEARGASFETVHTNIVDILEKVINPSMNRIRKLTFPSSLDFGSNLDRNYPLLMAHPGTSLESLVITPTLAEWPFIISYLRTLIASAPLLRDLKASFHFVLLKPMVNWTILQSLNLLNGSGLTATEAIFILVSSPKMERFAIRIGRSWGRSSTVTENDYNRSSLPAVVPCASLRTFQVQVDSRGGGDLRDLFDKVLFRRLASFEVSGPGAEESTALEVSRALEQSRDSLQRLRIPSTMADQIFNMILNTHGSSLSITSITEVYPLVLHRCTSKDRADVYSWKIYVPPEFTTTLGAFFSLRPPKVLYVITSEDPKLTVDDQLILQSLPPSMPPSNTLNRDDSTRTTDTLPAGSDSEPNSTLGSSTISGAVLSTDKPAGERPRLTIKLPARLPKCPLPTPSPEKPRTKRKRKGRVTEDQEDDEDVGPSTMPAVSSREGLRRQRRFTEKARVECEVCRESVVSVSESISKNGKIYHSQCANNKRDSRLTL